MMLALGRCLEGATSRDLGEMDLGLRLLESVRGANRTVAERRGGTDVATVKELHLGRVVH